mmetsp:Transcript_6115/g.12780  ORF Transcript_6115/g.12780 Transcript_6115/m.12780 type:complete len:97 (+) Transcript_6115:2546-2836(+)
MIDSIDVDSCGDAEPLANSFAYSLSMVQFYDPTRSKEMMEDIDGCNKYVSAGSKTRLILIVHYGENDDDVGPLSFFKRTRFIGDKNYGGEKNNGGS